MKAQLAALALVAATVFAAAPAGAVAYSSSAASAPMASMALGDPSVPANWPGSSWDATPQAELSYLKSVCPTVDAHPSSYSATLDRFCQEIRG